MNFNDLVVFARSFWEKALAASRSARSTVLGQSQKERS